MITSREVTTQIEYFKRYPVYELSTRAACELLNKKLPHGANLTSSEVEVIAKLTGNAPLALQIVGALWTLPNPPTPSVIIEELQQRPIPLLSQDEFEYKINVSIDLSYRYLSFEMQKIGHYLANFPGSFDESAAIFIYNMAPSDIIMLDSDSYILLPVGNITATLNSLIRRSLIEFDSRTQRYQFHRLIKEFFREKQMSIGEIGQNETKRFTHNFQVYYSKQLKSCGSTFQTDYRQALATFHTERHNFQKLLDDLNTGKYHSVDSFLRIILGIITATDSGLLLSSFTAEELVHPLQSALKHFDRIVKRLLSKQLMLNESLFGAEQFGDFYTTLLYQLSEMEEQRFGPQKAMETCQQRKQIVESFNITASSMAATAYQNFYTKLGDYQAALENHEEAALCEMKWISLRVKDLVSSCDEHSTKCSYYELGEVLYRMSKIEKAADLFEKSHKHEQLPGLKKLFLLYHMIMVYEHLNEPTKVEVYSQELHEVVQQEVSTTSPSQLIASSTSLQNVITYLRDLGKADLAAALEGRLLEAIMEVGARPSVLSTPKKTLEVINYYYNGRDYNKTHLLSLFLLNSLQHLKEQHGEVEEIKLKTEVLIAKAKFHSGNYSQGMDDMEVILGSILENQTEKLYEKELSDACSYLIPRLKYITTCYPTITLVVVKLPLDIIFKLPYKLPVYIILFGIPLDPVRVNEFCYMYKQEVKVTNPVPKSLIPKFVWHSNSTDLTVTQEYPVQQLLIDIPSSLFKQIKPAILSLLSWYFHTILDCVCFILKFPIVCFTLNVLLVFVRLYIALVIALISCIMLFSVPYALLVRLAIIVPLYRLFFKYPEYYIFPPTIMLLNVVFFIDTVIDVSLLAYCSCIIYLITGFNLFSFNVSRGWYGFMYQFD